jgi:hypothetical protein
MPKLTQTAHVTSYFHKIPLDKLIEITNRTPQVLYKYRDWNNPFHKRILTENEIYFASADQFNDPFDASLPFTYNPEELTDANILAKLIEIRRLSFPLESEEESINHAKERMTEVDFKSQEYFESMYPYLRKSLHEKVGIFSMTRSRDNLLMWAHYANCHKGFCVGIKKSALNIIPFVQLLRVEYSNKFPSRALFLNDEDQNKFLLEILTTKSTHWKYEREYRLLAMLNTKTTFKLSNDYITEIIFGTSMTDKAKEEIRMIRNVKFPKAKVYETSLDSKQFSLKFREII